MQIRGYLTYVFALIAACKGTVDVCCHSLIRFETRRHQCNSKERRKKREKKTLRVLSSGLHHFSGPRTIYSTRECIAPVRNTRRGVRSRAVHGRTTLFYATSIQPPLLSATTTSSRTTTPLRHHPPTITHQPNHPVAYWDS